MSSHINFWEVPYSFGVKKQVYCTLGCLYFSLKDTTAGAGKKNISQLPQNKIRISPVLVTKKAPKPLFESLFSSPDGGLPPEQLGTTAVLVPPKSCGNSLAVTGEVGLGMRNSILSKSDHLVTRTSNNIQKSLLWRIQICVFHYLILVVNI